MDVPVKKRGAYQIRVAIRDQATQKIGSASQFLEVPELKKGRMALTSLVLWDPRRPGESAHDMGLTAVRRQFPQGADLAYGCVLEHGKNAATTPVEVKVRVFRDDAEVFAGPANLSEIDGGFRTLSGTLRLAPAIKPGEYYLQVIARDRDQQKNTAVQWTDFQVLLP
jgi:hypothetical protein